MKSAIHILVILFLFPSPADARQVSEQQLLEWTSRVGQMIYSYHTSFDVAVQSIRSREDDEFTPEIYAGGPYEDGWAFSFGALNEDSEFILDYGVIVGGNGEILNFDAFDFHRPASFYHNLAANALQVVEQEFEQLRNESEDFTADSYRFAVLPFPGEHVTAFVSPYDNCPEISYFGNDATYMVDRETLEIKSHNRYHHRLLPLPKELPDNAVIAMLDVPNAPYPSPLDVSQTIRRGKPMIIRTANGFFNISPSGSIEKVPEDNPMVKDF